MREATRAFAARGYDGAFIDDVARRAKVTKGALYHQFRDKKDVFDAVATERVENLVERVKAQSGEEMERLGVSRNAWKRALAGIEVLLDGLCDPANRRILLLDGPAVLGRPRWHEIWGTPMLRLLRGIFRHAGERGDIAPELVEPLTHMLYGALQETALAIASAEDSDAARERFGEAARWVIEALLAPRGAKR